MSKKETAVRAIDGKKRLIYAFGRAVVNVFFMVFHRVRYFGKRNIPDTGPLLIVANHQSMYDPALIGAGITRRRCNYLARKTLFKFKPFAWLIDLYDAIPLDNDRIGYEGIKETLRRLKNGEAVLIFPEGARTFDGAIVPFKPGFLTLALRSGAAIQPVAIAGCFEAWPRTNALPYPFGAVRVVYGKPIAPEQAKTMPEEELQRLVESRVRELYETLQNALR
ncbi:MAG TPA: 1-acyl-sn-glycerol-3-phosphate acyltransferase [Planctomycetaceae bacterium]|nr:1-acyl-sn-glycerol-3-phosphate acyltransferase [Planctomycetaceae bacterium]